MRAARRLTGFPRFGSAAGPPRRWAFAWIALLALPFLVVGGVVEYQWQLDPGVELTVLRDDGQGHCTVRWSDPLDGRVRQGPFACDPNRSPLLRDWEYGFEASSWPWRGDLHNADGVGTYEDDVMQGTELAGLALLLVAGVGGTVRIVRRRRAAVGAKTVGTVPPLPVLREPVRKVSTALPRSVALIAAGAVALAVSGGLLAVGLPHARQRAQDFRAAAPCSSSANRSGDVRPDRSATPGADQNADQNAGPDAADCLSAEQFTVEEVRIHTGKHSSYTADLLEEESFTTRHVRFDGASPLLDQLETGDTVRGTLWRSDIVAVTSDDGRTKQVTSADPTDDPSKLQGGGVLLAVVGAGLVTVGTGAVAVRRLRRVRAA